MRGDLCSGSARWVINGLISNKSMGARLQHQYTDTAHNGRPGLAGVHYYALYLAEVLEASNKGQPSFTVFTGSIC